MNVKECSATHLILTITYPKEVPHIPNYTSLIVLHVWKTWPLSIKAAYLENWNFQKLQILCWQLIGLKFDIKSWVNFENNA